MSFGFDAGNFADAAHLAYLIYRDCYKVARGAPQEFQLLVSEVSTLSNSLKILQEDVKDPDSSLVQAGDDRVKLVNDMVGNIRITLNKMEKIARKYEIMGSTTASKTKQMWTRFKWTFDWSTIENLRGKLNQHNTMMSLLLTQVGNSSLQKIQSSTNAMESDISEIREYIASQQGDQTGNQKGLQGISIPSLSLEHDESLTKDDISRSSLSASLLKHAEVHQPWSTIGVSQWIETGTWWLLRAQLDIRPIATPGSTIPKTAYANLIKASWILIDIIACHPQVPFVSSTTRAQITALSTQIKQVYERLKKSDLVVPNFEEVEAQDLYIWEEYQSKELLLRPQLASPASTLSNLWAVEGDEQVLFLKITECDFTASGLNVCVVLFLAQQDGRAMRLVAKRQNGTVILIIPFTKLVTLDVGLDGVIVNDQKFLLDDKVDIQRLSSLIEAANFYLLQRRATHFSLQVFSFWLILVAVRKGCKELLSVLYSSLYSSVSAPVQYDFLEHRMYQKTKSLIQTILGGDGISGPRCNFHHGEDPSGQDLGWLYWAIWIGDPHLVNFFMLEGMTAIHNPWHELPPLHIAALYGHDAVAHTIVADSSEDAKTLARERDGDGRQALYHAIRYGHEKVAKSLLSWGAEMENVSDMGQTALHIAAEQGHANVIQLLLDEGAEQDARDDYDKTPLLLACEYKRESAIALFAEKQVDFTLRDEGGRNAWQIALHPLRTGDLRKPYNRGPSQSTFDLIMKTFWAGEMPQTMPLPKQRRAIASFEVDSDWALLTLDSRYARFEHPSPLPSHFTDMFGRSIEVRAPAGKPALRDRSAIEINIVFACETLDFSTAHGTLSITGGYGWTRLKIRGGGEFKSSIREFDSTGLNFRNHRNIATDPNAEEISCALGF